MALQSIAAVVHCEVFFLFPFVLQCVYILNGWLLKVTQSVHLDIQWRYIGNLLQHLSACIWRECYIRFKARYRNRGI